MQPVAITLDVVMPEMDGWEVLRELKDDPTTRDIPVLVVTMTDDCELGYALGAAEFLTKPVNRAQLVELLARHAPAGSEPRALVVDDLPESRALLRRALEQEGWQADEAENGRVALERIAQSRPALVLLDLMMPVMDGFEFMDELRKRDDTANIPVVVVTAKDLSDEDRARLNGDVAGLIQRRGIGRAELLAQLSEQITRAGQRAEDATEAE